MNDINDSRTIVVNPAGALPEVEKESADAFLYTFLLTSWLRTGETASAASASVSPAGLTVGSPTVDITGTEIDVLLSSGTSGTTYTVTLSITVTGGQTKTTKLSVYIL